ncbi:hypothetical protein [Candidatus Manganitrophus noduliformans]|uniref:Uncharacterized protein n=1 Tax=Candidatus Manganitrophus noduliformans TaxID=2606439 RepID=A0A7X6IA40_9BACT|nr:hypothetical protein [Candidatus Manganitrophus noduliformans]NKE70316.1 hypothetical protein [Candidatus Manganitrophus noduliformans]
MASVSNIVMSLSAGSTASTANVTVTGTMTFEASEVGKSFRMEIGIFGEDKSGDKLPAGDPVGDDLLYPFQWGFLLPKKPYKQFTVMAAGPQTFTETRSISNEKLDEDPGKVKIAEADINTPVYFPRQDEVYAKVSLSGSPVSARSSTVIAGIGV